MKITELITKLEAMKAAHGDRIVVIADRGEYEPVLSAIAVTGYQHIQRKYDYAGRPANDYPDPVPLLALG